MKIPVSFVSSLARGHRSKVHELVPRTLQYLHLMLGCLDRDLPWCHIDLANANDNGDAEC
jgi:hypothetical protein